MNNFELTEAIYYIGPSSQYVFTEEEVAFIEREIQNLVVHKPTKDFDPSNINGSSACYLLTDQKGKTVKLRVTITGTPHHLEGWGTLDERSYACDIEAIQPLDDLLRETWYREFSPAAREQ